MTAPAQTPPGKRRLYQVLGWIPGLLVVVGCVYALEKVDLHLLAQSLLTVRLWPLGLAVFFAMLAVVGHATYWWILVGTVSTVGWQTMIAYGFAASATNVLPMRAGDALRIWLVRTRHGVPLALSGAIIAIEKVADASSLLLLISPLPWLIPNLPPSVGQALRIFPCIILVAGIAMVIASRHSSRWQILSGFSVIRRPRVILAGVACIFLAWVADVACILSVLTAVHIAPTLDKALLVILSVNVAIAVPVTPGQVGAHELGSTVALALVGVPEAQAIPFALLYHASQLLPTLAIGLFTARTLSRERLAAEALEARAPANDAAK